MASFRAKVLPIIVFVFGVIANASIYVFARVLKQEGPWPSNTITNYSNHYPGYIGFRALMIFAVPLM